MQASPGDPQRPAGQTGGSPQRPPHLLREPVTTLDVVREVDALRQEPAWLDGDRNAKTFVKGPDLRVVLATFKPGAVMREYRVPGSATVQTVTGRVRLRVAGRVEEVSAGRVVMLDPNLLHDIEAVEESVVVITIAWSGGVRGDESRL